jgi:hypothetical protein
MTRIGALRRREPTQAQLARAQRLEYRCGMGLERTAVRLTWATLLAALLTALAACSGTSQPAASRPAVSHASPGHSTVPAANAAAGSACPAPPITPLPVWARAGFMPPSQARPHVLGVHGGIVAILWADRNALYAPPRPDRGNKILWVSKLSLVPVSPLKIRATSVSTGQTITTEVSGGPGPSTIDVPTAGCWIFALSWSGHTDQVSLRYTSAHASDG